MRQVGECRGCGVNVASVWCVLCVQDVFPEGDLLLGFWSDEVGMDT